MYYVNLSKIFHNYEIIILNTRFFLNYTLFALFCFYFGPEQAHCGSVYADNFICEPTTDCFCIRKKKHFLLLRLRWLFLKLVFILNRQHSSQAHLPNVCLQEFVKYILQSSICHRQLFFIFGFVFIISTPLFPILCAQLTLFCPHQKLGSLFPPKTQSHPVRSSSNDIFSMHFLLFQAGCVWPPFFLHTIQLSAVFFVVITTSALLFIFSHFDQVRDQNLSVFLNTHKTTHSSCC